MKTNTLSFNTQALRKKVLNLAMRGKLVPQDLNDEPASVSLGRIKSERAALVKERKLKRSKNLPKITGDKEPFSIPDSWKWTYLNDVANITKLAGFEYTKYIRPNLTNKGIPLFKAKNIQPGVIIEDFENYIPEDISDSLIRSQLNKKCLLTPYVGSIGKVAIFSGKYKAHLGSNVGKIEMIKVENRGVSEEFIMYYLQSSYGFEQLTKHLKSTAQPSISITALRETIVPFPPLEEQKRIVAKISRLFDQIDKIELASRQYTELQSSLRSKVLEVAIHGKLVRQDSTDEPAGVLLDKIKSEKDELIKEKKIKKSKPLPEITDDEKLFDIPDSWEWVRLGDIGVWAAGATPSRKHPEYYGGNIPWLKTGDLTDGVVNTTSEKITELGVKNSSVKLNKPGNVLIAMYGATIGKLGIVGDKEIVTNQACCGCNLFDGVYNWYLFYYLLASRRRLIKLGSGGAQPNISKKKIENFVFPVPPLEEQKRIVNKIEKVFSSL
ncbi:hypothetical protein BHL93_02715 [Limosilactobacillus reuteri]|nr:hypothetical protein BHL93_02715 [Limosilactobacillus reuteri]